MWCICNRLQNNQRTFHAIDMIQECARGFYDKGAADEFQFRGNQEDYTHVLERIYNPLLQQGMLEEYENNNYRIPEGSLLEQICTRELSGGQAYIDYDNIVEFQG